MALIDLELPLSGGGGPTLSGGMQFKTAGSGLPNRITVQDDAVVAPAFVSSIGSIMIDPDGAHFWLSDYTGICTKYLLADASNTGITTPAGAMGIFAYDGSVFYAGDYSNEAVVEYNYDGTVSRSMDMSADPSYPRPMSVVRASASDLVWIVNYPSSIPAEYNFPAATATGRTLPSSADMIFARNGFLYSIDGNNVTKYDEATLTLQETWTFIQDNATWPGHTFPGYVLDFYVDSTDHPIVYNALAFWIDRLVVSPGASIGPDMVDKRLVYQQPQLGGSGLQDSNPTPGIAVNDKYAVFVSTTGAGANSFCAVVKNLFGTQRARWNKSFPQGGTIERIAVPGNYVGDKGSTYDLRKTKFYWSIDGGGSRTEFLPGDNLNIAVPSGGTLTFDVDMIEGDGQATNPPYIGGTAGEGPRVIYDDGTSGSFVATSCTGSASKVTVAFNMAPTALTGPAAAPSNWTITVPNSVQVTAVNIVGSTIELTTTNQTQGGSYTLNIPVGIMSGSNGFLGPYSMDFTGVASIPALQFARSLDEFTVDVTFTFAPNESDALDVTNWGITPPITIFSVTKITDLNYRLTTSSQTIGQSYTLSWTP